MPYVVYLLEDQKNKTWYTGVTSNLKRRMSQHHSGNVASTKTKTSLKLIYVEMYLDKRDALGREKFLKSGSGKQFLKKQLRHYFSVL